MPKRSRTSDSAAGRPRVHEGGARTISFYLSDELVERLEGYLTPDDGFNMSALVTQMLERELRRMDGKR